MVVVVGDTGFSCWPGAELVDRRLGTPKVIGWSLIGWALAVGS